MTSRATYEEIRRDLLAMYLTGCASRGFRGESQETVCSWAYCEFDGAYELPIENLMFEVTALALTGGWYGNMEKAIRRQISSIISKSSLQDLLASVDADEVDELVRDMRVLGVVEKDFKL